MIYYLLNLSYIQNKYLFVCCKQKKTLGIGSIDDDDRFLFCNVFRDQMDE